MINRVGDSNYTNPYAENRKKVSQTQDAPAFLLNYDEKGVVWDREEKKEDKEEVQKKTPKNNPKTVAQKDTYESSVKKEEKTEDTSPSIFNSLSRIFSTIASGARNLFKSAFRFIWYGNENEADKKEDINKEDTNLKISDNEKTENTYKASKEKYINSMDKEYYQKLEQARKGVSGVPARNTSLLTTYDKRGEIKKVDASESDMVLRGDKSLKL